MTFTSEFSVSFDESLAFARLSGDFNPLHIDPVAARRVRYGSTVTHGIHLYLRALEELAARGLLNGYNPVALSASFDHPVLTDTPVQLSVFAQVGRMRIRAETGGRTAIAGTIELNRMTMQGDAAVDAEFVSAGPSDLVFPPSDTDGSVPLQLSTKLMATLFPALHRSAGGALWIADLLATTQIVGMRCPGMHSIYSGFRLRRAATRAGPLGSMRYHVNGIEQRFQLLRMEIAGAWLQGTIEAFFRPRPVTQLPMKDIARVISTGAFTGHRVLIVGGSRGLGELTAKMVAAGGDDVTITYALGKEDAERVCADVRMQGGRCNARQMDVLAVVSQGVPEWLTSLRFSHVYFFASAPVTRNPGNWSELLFRQFAQIYVAAFAIVAERVLAVRDPQGPLLSFLYPSSVFVTKPEAGFAEYAVAKAAGEALCDQLQRKHRARFFKPRLPRVKTDQTSSLTDIGAMDPFPVMLEVVRDMHA